MKGMGYFFKPVKKRPVLLLIIGIITFLYCFIEYSFIMPIVFGLSILKTGNIFDSIMHLIQIVLNNITTINPVNIVFVIVGVTAVSLIAGLVLSGSLNVLNSSLIDSAKEKKVFAKGIQKHYLKVFRITFFSILFLVLFLIFMVVVAIPSIVITSAATTEKPELLSVSGILNFITIGIMFFSFMFFRVYILFWYPATINFDKKLFAKGKRAADASFWSIVLKFIWYDVLIVLFQVALFYANTLLSKDESMLSEVLSVAILLFANWIFKTVLVISILSFVFSKFIAHWNKSKAIANEQ